MFVEFTRNGTKRTINTEYVMEIAPAGEGTTAIFLTTGKAMVDAEYDAVVKVVRG